MINKNIIAVLSIVALLVFTDYAFAQTTIIKFPTNDNTSSFDILKNNNGNLFRLFGDGGFYLTGTVDAGAIPITGAGVRFMWHPVKAAFRVGEVNGTQWDNANTGYRSVAMGHNTTASGNNSLAVGSSTIASGNQSTAFGNGSTASGDNSFSFNGTSTGTGSISFGMNSEANGDESIAIGNSSIANGTGSITIGPSVSNGQNSIALGWFSNASGDYSIAIGKYAGTNGKTGSIVFGDGSSVTSADTVYNTADNQMAMRFANGYRFYTTQNLSTGVEVTPGGNSWSAISDSTKKTNFIKADTEYFLNGLSQLRLGSWNYKSQDKSFRHYGPMAQEIFKYFGIDELGLIGNDTTLATADVDGIVMICIKGLEKRSSELKAKQSEIVKAIDKISELESLYSSQETKLSSQEAIIEEFRKQLSVMKEKITALKEKKMTAVSLVKSEEKN